VRVGVHFGRNAEGTDCISRPSKSRIWLEKMMSAMPLVESDRDRVGDELDRAAEPESPKATRMTPAMSVAMTRPSTPCCSTIPETMTTNAPVVRRSVPASRRAVR